MNNNLDLYNNNLTELTEDDLIQFCNLNNIKPEYIIEIDLGKNSLKNLNCFKKNTLFKNVNYIHLYSNPLININGLKYLQNLKAVDLSKNLNLKNINFIKYLDNLDEIDFEGSNINDISVLNDKKIKSLNISLLNFKNERKTLETLKTMKFLNYLKCYNTFNSISEDEIEDNLKHISKIKFYDL